MAPPSQVSVDARQRPRGEVRDVKLFRFADTLRGRTASAVQSLRDDNHLEIVVLTGDNAHAASAVARMLDLEDFQVSRRANIGVLVYCNRARKDALVCVSRSCHTCTIDVLSR